MKKDSPTYLMAAIIPLIGPLIIDFHFGFRHVLSVCKRLKAKVFKRVVNEYKRLIKYSNIENNGFMEFDTVAPIGGLRI
ncbi:MAG: hypothetical protein IPK46_06145 [Saprospiraceae bacterium]|nr:hypothetical protein [Saprospiraceae bacterium]